MQLSQIIVMMLRYGKCSLSVKLTVFKAYCMCFYDSGLWRNFSRTMINKLHTCYNKSISCAFITSYFKHIIETFCDFWFYTYVDNEKCMPQSGCMLHKFGEAWHGCVCTLPSDESGTTNPVIRSSFSSELTLTCQTF